MAKKSIKKQPVKTEVKKPSSIYFADYSNKVPTHITPVAKPMVFAPTYNANAVLRAAGANVVDYKPVAEQVDKIFKKIDYSNIKDRKQIIDTAIDQVLGAEADPNKKKQLETLLRMTNYMENKYGEADDAWKNKNVNYGFTELDKISIDNLFKPKGDKGNYTKAQKNAFEYLKNFGLPTDQKELEKLLLNNDPLANMAVSRLVYATNPKPLPDMNDQKAVFNYWLNDYNHRGAIKHQTEEDLFKIFQEGYNKYNSPNYKPVIHVNSDGTAVIDDNRGQWEHPGEVTRIASNDITMKGVPYPVLGVGADGEQRMMYPEEEHTFNQGPVTEYPMMQAKDGGWLSQYRKHENLRADGTKKGTGYLGILNRPDGGVSTEISMGVEFDGKEVEIPTMVPTLTKEELNYLLTTPVDKEDLFHTPMGESIANKAIEHAKQRISKGLNPFYQEGEERSGLPRHLQNPGIASVYEENNKPDWTNVASEYKRGGTTWLNEYGNGGKVSKEELEYLQSVAAEDFQSNPRNTEIERQKAELTKKTQMSETSLDLEKEIAKQSLLSKLRELSGKNEEPVDYYRGSTAPREIIKNNYIYTNPGDKVVTTTEGTMPRIKPVNAVDDGIFLAFADAVAEYKELYPNRPVPRISSGLRTRAEQEQLYANRANNRYPVAKPGTSKHELGKALDIVFDGGNDSDYQRLAALMSPRGFKWLGDYDKVHFEVDPNYPKTDISESGNVIITNQMPSMQLDVNHPTARSFKNGGWLNKYAQGGKTFTAGGEKHRVYEKESPTGNGKGVKGHIMVTHPTKDKGKWDTIDLTKIAGAKTVAQGVAATKKWHAENPEYQTGGPTTRYSYVLDDNNGNTVFDDNGNPIIINPTTNYTVPEWLPQVNITAPRIIPSSDPAGSTPQSNASLAADIALDGMQFIPGPLGAAASAVGVGKNLYEGDYIGAGLDLANLVTLGGAKWLTLASDLANAAGKANKAGRLAKQSKILEHASNPNLWRTTGTVRDLAKVKTTDSNPEYKNEPKKAPNLLGKKNGGWLNNYK